MKIAEQALSNNTKRLRMLRFPLFLGLLVNFALVAYMPFRHMQQRPVVVQSQRTINAEETMNVGFATPDATERDDAYSEGADSVATVDDQSNSSDATSKHTTAISDDGRIDDSAVTDGRVEEYETEDEESEVNDSTSNQLVEEPGEPSVKSAQPTPRADVQVVEEVEVTESESEAAVRENRLLIRNAKSNGATVAFLLGKDVKKVTPGDEIQVDMSKAEADSYVVQFHRGGGFGKAADKVSAGAYEFRVTAQGWQLVELND